MWWLPEVLLPLWHEPPPLQDPLPLLCGGNTRWLTVTCAALFGKPSSPLHQSPTPPRMPGHYVIRQTGCSRIARACLQAWPSGGTKLKDSIFSASWDEPSTVTSSVASSPSVLPHFTTLSLDPLHGLVSSKGKKKRTPDISMASLFSYCARNSLRWRLWRRNLSPCLLPFPYQPHLSGYQLLTFLLPPKGPHLQPEMPLTKRTSMPRLLCHSCNWVPQWPPPLLCHMCPPSPSWMPFPRMRVGAGWITSCSVTPALGPLYSKMGWSTTLIPLSWTVQVEDPATVSCLTWRVQLPPRYQKQSFQPELLLRTWPHLFIRSLWASNNSLSPSSLVVSLDKQIFWALVALY